MRSILAFPLVLVACTGSTSPYHEDLLPTQEKVQVNMPVDEASAKDETAGGFARYYAVTRTVTEDVNGMIAFVLGTVGYVTTLEPQWSDADEKTAMWGPYSDSGLDPVETGLWVRQEDDASYTWAIFQEPKGGDPATDAIAIVAGVVDAGSTRDDATGNFVVDFDTASSLDPAVGLAGTFAVDYDYDAEGVAAVAGFSNYGTVDGERYDAAYAYDEDYAGAGSMDLAWLDDVNATGTDEVLAMRTRWESTGDGRSDAIVTGGDLGVDSVTASECWGSDFAESYWTDSIGLYEAAGDVGACAWADAELPTDGSFSLAE
jgi:hypothetical protein